MTLRGAFLISILVSGPRLNAQEPPVSKPSIEDGAKSLPVLSKWGWVEDSEIMWLDSLSTKSGFTKVDAETIMVIFLRLKTTYGSEVSHTLKIQDQNGEWLIWDVGGLPLALSSGYPDGRVNKRTGKLSIPAEKLELTPSELARFIREHRTKNRFEASSGA